MKNYILEFTFQITPTSESETWYLKNFDSKDVFLTLHQDEAYVFNNLKTTQEMALKWLNNDPKNNKEATIKEFITTNPDIKYLDERKLLYPNTRFP